MERSIDRIPDYLKTYVVEQNYEKYTPQDQAVWRFIMRQSRDYFSKHAHPIYLRGLEETGIPITEIPNIDEMDKKLSKFGWGAVCICGFIPSAAFLDFLAKKILPIASDMRTLDHLHYTPAPDIVHEAAGHAPIIADEAYRNYLSRYAFLAKKAIYSVEDIKVYEAVRLLSDLKENPDATSEEIVSAEADLQATVDEVSWVTESAKVLRMSWWTTEYGLMGPVNTGNIHDLKIYGAGLLSSIGESAEVYSDNVKKIPLSLDCIEVGIDITEPQPQLYVAENVDHLNNVLSDLENTMSFKKGGTSAVEMAKRAQTVTTTELDSGVQISGIVETIKKKNDVPCFIKWSSKCQLAVTGVELTGQGIDRHPGGFSSPIGRWKGIDKSPADLSKKELSAMGLLEGESTSLTFESGIVVKGTIKKLTFAGEKLVLITFDNASSHYDTETLYQPDWGPFDMVVGELVVSVFGGPADWNTFGDYDIGKISSQPGRVTPYTKREKELFALYKRVREFRGGISKNENADEIKEVARKLLRDFPDEWLLALELYEIHSTTNLDDIDWQNLIKQVDKQVLCCDNHAPETKKMIERGKSLKLISDE